MQIFSFKKTLAVTTSAAILATMLSTPAFAQSSDTSVVADEIITIGTRRKARSASDVIAPVDVIPAQELLNQAPNDIADALRIAVPSFNVNTQPISDAATIVRPANLRGLSPDNTLVLLNGKRRHRASVISFLGGGIADGAHGPDISVFPALALKNVQVLRDGASSQYGSDAIAGVINFELKDAAEGGVFEARYGETYEGDGENYRIAGNIGFPLGDNGFINITGEYAEVNDTNRSIARDDVTALVAAGNLDVLDISVNTLTTDIDSVQIWGQPNVNDDIKLFVNTGFDISDSLELYAWGNYAERQVEGGFFFRNPTNRGGVFEGPTVDPITGAASDADNAVASVSVGNLNGLDATACPAGIPLTGAGGVIPDATVLAQVVADENCFSFIETLPGGFVPRFGGDNQDIAFVVGARGDIDLGTGLGYDLSFSYGENITDFFINNTINASLGPDTPRDFQPGGYEQEDINFNFDLNYGLPISGWASDLNIATGFEYREETFTINQGDDASFALGPLTVPTDGFPAGQGFASSSNGFPGFVPAAAGSFSQDNIAVYGDLEADVTEQLSLQGALRYEDFSSFGDTLNWKVGGKYTVNDNLTLRGTVSTGFHAPTAGQANVVNITTAFVGGVLQDVATLPLTSAAGEFLNAQRVADGDQPFTLDAEDSTNVSVGFATQFGDLSLTVDYFNIDLEGRISLTDNQDFGAALEGFAAANGVDLTGVSGTSQLINVLDGVAGFNASDFAGSEDLAAFAVFANNFDTRTQGIDVVASMPFDLGQGSSSVTFAGNWTDTDVTNRGEIEPIGDLRTRSLEENIPSFKGNLTFNHEQGPLRGLIRANYHSSFFEDHLGTNGFPIDLGSEINFDAEITYALPILEGAEISVGASNIFDNTPDSLADIPLDGFTSVGAVAGAEFPSTAPFGFNGGQWYVRTRYTF
ncbi:MAG: TonB-dependent receptor [Maricaulaceae bacterium]